MINIEYELTIEDEDISPRGEFSSGDKEADEKQADEIIDRLNRGDLWAWCYVKVTACIEGFDVTGWTGIGGCSYDNEADFKQNSGYFEEMCREARADLIKNLRARIASAIEAEKLLAELGEQK